MRNQAEAELGEEQRRLLRLRWRVDVAKAVLCQDAGLTLEGARLLIDRVRDSILEEFPGKEATFDLIILPRLERIVRERWGSGLAVRLQ